VRIIANPRLILSFLYQIPECLSVLSPLFLWPGILNGGAGVTPHSWDFVDFSFFSSIHLSFPLRHVAFVLAHKTFYCPSFLAPSFSSSRVRPFWTPFSLALVCLTFLEYYPPPLFPVFLLLYVLFNEWSSPITVIPFPQNFPHDSPTCNHTVPPTPPRKTLVGPLYPFPEPSSTLRLSEVSLPRLHPLSLALGSFMARLSFFAHSSPALFFFLLSLPNPSLLNLKDPANCPFYHTSLLPLVIYADFTEIEFLTPLFRTFPRFLLFLTFFFSFLQPPPDT